MNTNLTVELVYITPGVAKEYLRHNNENRKVSETNLKFISKQMNENKWIENGESIVFDYNGKLKDGQHRLLALVETKSSYFFPVVRGVQPESMATIDTGKNRSAADVLDLNGFMYANDMASFIKSINKYVFNKSKAGNGIAGANKKTALTNMEVLNYATLHKEQLTRLCQVVHKVYKRQALKVFSKSQLATITYLIAGYNFNETHVSFLEAMTGVNSQYGTAPHYLFDKVTKAKNSKNLLSTYWIYGVAVKAWNLYIDGNPSVRSVIFNIEKDLPIAEKIY